MRKTLRSSPHYVHWQLDPAMHFLNHGSFGATPLPVQEAQQQLRLRMEKQPVLFLDRELEPLLDVSRQALGALLNAPAEDLVFLPNATTAVNTVLRSLPLKPGDEILFCSQAYNACRNAVVEVCQATGACPVCVPLPYPVTSSEQLRQPWLDAVTPRTRLALIDHITSPTALVLPLDELVPALQSQGVDVLVDGAHVPGQLPLNIAEMNPAYYTGNCHKWLCSPKGSAFLYVRKDHQAHVRPLVISHGANSARTDRSRFRLEFDWLGTVDPTAYLAIPEAITFLDSLMPLADRIRTNHDLALYGRNLLVDLFQEPPPCPDYMLGSMASFPLPDRISIAPNPAQRVDPLGLWLWDKHHIEIPIIPRPTRPTRLIRLSAQLYNCQDDYLALVDALKELM